MVLTGLFLFCFVYLKTFNILSVRNRATLIFGVKTHFFIRLSSWAILFIQFIVYSLIPLTLAFGSPMDEAYVLATSKA